MQSLGNNYLIVLDIDGTINGKDKGGKLRISQSFKELYPKLMKAGNIELVFNTTRGPFRIIETLTEDDRQFFGKGIAATANGSIVFDLINKEIVQSHPIDEGLREQLVSILSRYDISFMAYFTAKDLFGNVFLKDPLLVKDFYQNHKESFDNDSTRCTSNKEMFSQRMVKEEICMLQIRMNQDVDIDALAEELTDFDLSYDGNYYVTKRNVNKGSGLEYLKNHICKSDCNVIVAGDSNTDLAMINDKNHLNIIVGNQSVMQDIKYHRAANTEELCSILTKTLRL